MLGCAYLMMFHVPGPGIRFCALEDKSAKFDDESCVISIVRDEIFHKTCHNMVIKGVVNMQ